MQQILTEGELLDSDGNLAQCGYSVREVRKYDRNAIKAGKSRIKEWDYYLIGDSENAVALTIADNSYMSLVSVSVLDFVKAEYATASEIKFFSFGKLNLPNSSSGGVTQYQSKRATMSFKVEDGKRILTCSFKNLKKKDFECAIELQDPKDESMYIATPFNKKRHFYYNQKINCMPASGYYVYGGVRRELGADAMGLLDWGRGVWTYANTWYWGSLSTKLKDGRRFGFNLGYGFGDTSAATENMLFVDGKAHKLTNVDFGIPKVGKKFAYKDKWHFTADDGRIDFEFVPIIDRNDDTDFLVLQSLQHQVFGRFFGTATLDDGEVVRLDGDIGFAERVRNKW